MGNKGEHTIVEEKKWWGKRENASEREEVGNEILKHNLHPPEKCAAQT